MSLAAVECRLELDLVAETEPSGSGDGGDARAAQAETPRRATIIITAAGATIPTAEPARVQAYGTVANLKHKPGPPEYLPELNRIAVPFVSDTTTFAVKAVESRLLPMMKSPTFEYIESYYNPVRRHSALGYVSPEEFERAYYQGAKKASLTSKTVKERNAS